MREERVEPVSALRLIALMGASLTLRGGSTRNGKDPVKGTRAAASAAEREVSIAASAT